MKSKLLANSFSGTVLYAVNIIIAFFISPLFVHILGNHDYGLWELMISLVGYMGILDLGIGPALLRYVAIDYNNDNKSELQRVISSAQIFFMLIGTVTAVILILLSFFPHIIVDANKIDLKYFSLIISLFALNTGLSFPLTVYTATIMGLQRHYLCNSTRIVLTITRAIFAYHFLIKFPSKGLLLLVVLELVFNSCQFVLYYIFLKNDKSIPSFSLSACSLNKIKELFNYGAKCSILMIASRIQNASLPFVISMSLGVNHIVFFAMPNRLVEYAKGLSLAIGFPLTPYFVMQLSGDDKNVVKNSWLQTSLVLQIITVAMPLFILFCGERFLSLWIGKEYGVAGRGVLYWLVIALSVEAMAPNASRILMATGHHGRAAMMWLILSIISVPLAVIGASHWGVTGVAMGSSITLIVGNIVVLKMACNDVGTTVKEYLQQTLMKLVVPVLFLIISLWITNKLITQNSYLFLSFQVFLCASIYLLSVWFLTINNATRLHISDKLMFLIKRLGPTMS